MIGKSLFGEHKYQILGVLTVNIITLAHGAALGWISPALLILQSDETPLVSGPLTVEEVSLLGSIYAFGAITGNLLFGVITNNLGRMKAFYLLAIPQLILWLLLIFGDHVIYLYIMRVLTGVSGGGALVSVPLFTTEVADKKIRGSLGSILMLSINIGMLLGFIIGGSLNYNIVPRIFIILPTIFTILIWFFPETPQFYLKKNLEEEARKSLEFYRNIKTIDDKINLEIALNEMKENLQKQEMNGKNLTISDFCSSNGRKELLMVLGIVAIYMLNGCFLITQYAGNIFKILGATLDPNIGGIIIGSCQVIGTYLSTILADRFDRKTLIIASVSASAVGYASTGFLSLLYEKFNVQFANWLPILTLSSTIFFACCGLTPLGYVVVAEVLNNKIRPIGLSISNVASNIIGFVALMAFPILLIEIGIYGTMLQCSAVCVMAIFFYAYIIPETKGKSI